MEPRYSVEFRYPEDPWHRHCDGLTLAEAVALVQSMQSPQLQWRIVDAKGMVVS